jgi:hypothetical protein
MTLRLMTRRPFSLIRRSSRYRSRRSATVEMFVKTSHEGKPLDVGDRNDKIVVDVESAGLDVSAQHKIPTLRLIFAPRAGDCGARSILVFSDRHRAIGEPEEVFEAARRFTKPLGVMLLEVLVGP